MRYEQPCPRCGCRAGWARQGTRGLTYKFDPDGEVADLKEHYGRAALANAATCRGCHNELNPVEEDSDELLDEGQDAVCGA